MGNALQQTAILSGINKINVPVYSTDTPLDVIERSGVAEGIYLAAKRSGAAEGIYLAAKRTGSDDDDALDAVRHAGFHRD
jgi:hypothetical protein